MSKWVVHCKLAKYDVYIGRGQGSIWGNPFEIGKDGTRKEVIEKHKQWILSQPIMIERAKKELKGCVLGCWCKTKNKPNQPCHGDTLASIANNEPFEEIVEEVEEKEVDLWE